MRALKVERSSENRLMTTEQLKAYTNQGANKAKELAKEAGAIVYLGRSIRFDRIKIDAYLSKLTESK